MNDGESGLDIVPAERHKSTINAAKFKQLKVYPFVSELQRMCVVVKVIKSDGNGEKLWVLSKGSPEVISSLCDLNTGRPLSLVHFIF